MAHPLLRCDTPRRCLRAALLMAACCATRSELAVTMPFTLLGLGRMQQNFDVWARNPPCDLAARTRNVTFVFQFNKQLTPPVQQRLEHMWAGLGNATACFEAVLFLSANQTDEQEHGQTIGGCHQHYNTFPHLLSMGFNHWFQFESDVVPMRPNWLVRIADEAARNGPGCDRWWMQGAPPGYEPARVTNGQRVDGFIMNGNALYCLNEEVLDYLADVKAQYPPIGCHVPPNRARDGLTGLVGFDWVQYLYRTSVENRERFKGRQYLFQSVDWLADMNTVSRAEIDRYVVEHPSLVVVHTKSYF